MISDKLTGVHFFVDNYISIMEFNDIILDSDCQDPSYIAAIIGCVEGIIKNDNQYFSFLNMYKITNCSRYKFLNLYSFIKRYEEYYEYIVNYFNTWHRCEYDIFTYDEFNKNDLIMNFYELAALLLEERQLAEKCNDKEVFEAYNYFCRNLSSVLLNSLKV